MRNGTLSQKGIISLGNEHKVLFDVAKKGKQENRIREIDAKRGKEK